MVIPAADVETHRTAVTVATAVMVSGEVTAVIGERAETREEDTGEETPTIKATPPGITTSLRVTRVDTRTVAGATTASVAATEASPREPEEHLVIVTVGRPVEASSPVGEEETAGTTSSGRSSRTKVKLPCERSTQGQTPTMKSNPAGELCSCDV